MEGETFTEETEINIVGIIPAQLKDFTNVEIESINGKEVYLKIDEEKVKGKIEDTMGTTMFFASDEEKQEAELVTCAEKQVVFEHYFNVPKSEFKKPFLPSEALTK